MTMARSRSLTGPYELHPDKYIITARDRPHAPLQRAGHGDLVETQAGDTYAVYLCGRPLPNRGRCVLGRETAIQKMVWGADDWLRTRDGSGLPELETPAPALPAAPVRRRAAMRADFDSGQLPIDFQWLRSPYPEELFSLTARPGYLRLYGRETIGSMFRQSLVARRQQAHCYSAIDRDGVRAGALPAVRRAGLLLQLGEVPLSTCVARRGARRAPARDVVHAGLAAVRRLHGARSRFQRAASNCASRWISSACVLRTAPAADWNFLPELFDASILSDEATAPGAPNFTGAFVGMACQDMSGMANPADFDYFEYREREYLRTNE